MQDGLVHIRYRNSGNKTYGIPSRGSSETVSATTRVRSRGNIVETINASGVDDRVEETEGRLALGETEVVQERDNSGESLVVEMRDSQGFMNQNERTGELALVPPTEETRPPIKNWKPWP